MTAEKCSGAALRYVAVSSKTKGQVEDYLKRRGFMPSDIEEALAMLEEYGYIDDRKYCCAYYLYGCRKGRGRRRIEQELESKKISRIVIRESLDEFLSEENPDYCQIIEETLTEKDRARTVGEKMLKEQVASGKAVDKNFCAKVGRRLTAMGYDGSVIYSVIGYVMKSGEGSL